MRDKKNPENTEFLSKNSSVKNKNNQVHIVNESGPFSDDKKVKKGVFTSFKKKKKEAPKKEETAFEEIKVEEVEETTQNININKEEKPLEAKKEKKNKKNNRPKGSKGTFVCAIIVSVIISIGILCVLAGLLFANKLLEGKPELIVDDLIAPDSSVIYDSNDNKIMEIGMYLRENVDYEQLPNCLVDAVLAIEDSRFFEHPGFDLPRFTKAALINLRSGSFDQGGSTLTMQLLKNTYYQTDDGENSLVASREGMSGLKRKAQEIILAFELNFKKEITKKQVLAMYLNKVNYGNNIRGIEKASEYYFGKRCNELTLPEAAFLAGLINSPNSYNPYNNMFRGSNDYVDEDTDYLANGTQRRNEVLNLMVQHGYISEEEAKLAKSTKLQDQLVGIKDSFTETNEKYQSYIDAVIDEVEDVTGESPYEVGMAIHTNMNAYMQEYIYDLQNEEEYTGLTFPNEQCQSAIVLLDNQNGAIEALGAGRGEADSARKFNRATSAYLNPGSSIKPVVDYALAIETLGWATSHTITDQPYFLYGGNVLISNFDHTYYGDMLMTEALGRSQNTPAVQSLAAVVDAKDEEYVIDYLNSIGFNFEYEDFDLQFAIGGNTCLVTPLQLAGAHAMFINGGKYIRPHTVNYIEYNGKRENFVADTKGNQVISEATAWMTAYLEKYNMEGSFSSLMWYCKKDYPLYGKTGTTDWADAGLDYGIPSGATKDSWLLMQTNKYTISCWTGYDELEKGAYFTNAEYQENTKSKIVDKILDEIEVHHLGEYDPYKELKMPDTVQEITHIKGAYPYAYPDGAHETVTGYIAKKALEEKPLVSVSEALAYSSSIKKYVDAGAYNINGVYDGNTVNVTFDIGTSDGGLLSGESVDLSTTNYEGETEHAAGRIYFPHWVTVYTGIAQPPYTYTVKVNGVVTDQNVTGNQSFSALAPGGTQCEVCIAVNGSDSQSCSVIPLS